MENTELKPCPFCGGAASIERVGEWHELRAEHVGDCHLSGDSAEMCYKDAPGARERMAQVWNRRAAPAAGTGTAADNHQQAVSDLRKAAWERDPEAVIPAQLRVFAAFDARAEEARREGAEAERARLVQTITNANNTASELLRQRDEARAQLAAAQRPAGGELDYRRIAEDWCEVAVSGLQWLRNIASGAPVIVKARANMQQCIDDLHAKYPTAFSVTAAQPVEEAAAQADDRADRPGFEAWAKSHGGLPLDLAGDLLRTVDGDLYLPTYKFGRTEIAWRAWGNRPAAAPTAQPTPPDDEQAAFEAWAKEERPFDEIRFPGVAGWAAWQKRSEQCEARVADLLMQLAQKEEARVRLATAFESANARAALRHPPVTNGAAQPTQAGAEPAADIKPWRERFNPNSVHESYRYMMSLEAAEKEIADLRARLASAGAGEKGGAA